MARPACTEHPDGRTRRDGYYGRHKEFIRWECVPADGSPPHYLRQEQLDTGLRSKLTGGPESGCCDECERNWADGTDGMPSADHDNYVLREKVRTLIRLAQGSSYRAAGHTARLRVMVQRGEDPLPRRTSRDWRMAGDWVPQYTDIIANELLPTKWPRMIAVDSFDVRVTACKEDGTPKQKGELLYSVFGAVGYEHFGQAGALWHLRAFPREREQEFREFLSDLDGCRDVEVVLCDGSKAIRNAVQWAFPNATIYPCSWHLVNVLAGHCRRGRLNSTKRAIWRALRVETGDLLRERANWDEFSTLLDRYLRAIGPNAEERTAKALRGMDKWRQRNQDQLDLALDHHWPRDLKLLEEHLATVRSLLGERRRSFRNLPRLNALLKLMMLDIRGEAVETRWAHILRENHLGHHGQPPPRRRVDGQLLKLPPRGSPRSRTRP